MTGQQDNLRVLTEHVDELAAKQASAAGRLKIAGETVNDLASSVWATHGVVCAASNMAVDAIEAARDAANAKLWRKSHDLSERLKTASTNYNNADWLARKYIDSCSL
ncbi:MAG: ESX-1 secretion-associated protein [Actinomycetota bacterium]